MAPAYVSAPKVRKIGSFFYFSPFYWDQWGLDDDDLFHRYSHVAFNGFDGIEKQTPPRPPPSPTPASSPLESRDGSDAYFSCCRLEDAVEVVPCRSQPQPTGFGLVEPQSVGTVTGLLVHYANGDRASVGSFRFDWAERPCAVRQADRLYLGRARKGGWVREVRNSPPPPDDEDLAEVDWAEIPLSGTLEWWSARDRVKVEHIVEHIVADGSH
jgi:hypothetical protein